MSDSADQLSGESYSGGENSEELLAWRRECWQKGTRLSLESLLQTVPWLAEQPEAMLDLIYGDILLREDFGDVPKEEDYVVRFPELSEQIRRQFQVHRALMQDAESYYELETADYGKTFLQNPESIAVTDLSAVAGTDRFPRITGFQILSVAGRGGNGTAYRAMDTSLKRTVAIKLLDRDQSADSLRSQQLRREAEASAALVHPNIVRVFQVGEFDGSPFLVMEFIPGGSLADRLQGGPLPVREAVEFCRDVADALHFAHTHSIVHRDLKPGNILIDSDGRPRVCDFGLARKLNSDETLHQTGNVAGTPAYMPPEQARGEHVDVRADVYALGAVLYEMLSGRPPFQAATPWEILHQVLTSDVIPLRQLNPGLPRDLETICARCLEKNAARRYASAGEVADELSRFQKGEPVKARPIGRLPRLVKWIRRNPVTTAVISTVAASLIAVAGIALISEQRVSAALQKTENSLEIAETQRDVAMDAMSDLVFRVHDDLEKRQASVEARAEVLQSAIAGLKKIMAVAGDREDTRRTLATAYTRYGYILSQRGQNEEAEKAHLQGIEVAETLTSKLGRGICAQAYSNIALHYVRAANLQATDDWARKTLTLASSLLESDPGSVELQNIVIQAKTQLASATTVLKDVATAFPIRQDAQQMCAKLWAANPERTNVRDQLIDINQQLVTDCLTLGFFQLADQYLRETRELLLPQNPDVTEDVQVLRRYSTMLKSSGTVLFAMGKYEEAMDSLTVGIATYEKLATVEPNRPGFHLKLGIMHEEMANCCLALNRLDECEQYARRFIDEIRTGMELGGPTYSVQRYAIAKGQFLLGSVFLRKERPVDAVSQYRLAATELEPILDLYNTRDVHHHISTIAELIAGACGIEPNSADSSQVIPVGRSLDVWRGLLNDRPEVFVEQEQQLTEDLKAVTDQTLRGMLTIYLAAIYAQRYKQLATDKVLNETQMEALETRCIDLLKELQASPAAEPLLHMQLPEFSALRDSERFMREFPLK